MSIRFLFCVIKGAPIFMGNSLGKLICPRCKKDGRVYVGNMCPNCEVKLTPCEIGRIINKAIKAISCNKIKDRQRMNIPFECNIEYTGLEKNPDESDCKKKWMHWFCRCNAKNYLPWTDFEMFAFPSYPYMADRRDVIKRNINRKCWKCGNVWKTYQKDKK